jgi:hypothetical protein
VGLAGESFLLLIQVGQDVTEFVAFDVIRRGHNGH